MGYCRNCSLGHSCGYRACNKTPGSAKKRRPTVPRANRTATANVFTCGARVHNLQNVDLDIPRDRLVVITGPSGSGKSSLAFDTLFAEGQRQYIESLSVYARQFLHQMERPDVDLIEGLQPTISIDQRAGSRIRAAPSPRSRRSTIICGCCWPGWARRSATSAARRSASNRRRKFKNELLATAGRHEGDDPGADRSRPQRAAQGCVRGDSQGRLSARAASMAK